MASHNSSLTQEDGKLVLESLLAILRETNSQSALLVDKSGQIMITAGNIDSFDVTTFGSLCAGDFSANDQLAQILGEDEFSTLFHRGSSDLVFLSDVAKRFILVVVFDERAILGMVRIVVKRVAVKLTDYFFAKMISTSVQADSPLMGAFDEIDSLLSSW